MNEKLMISLHSIKLFFCITTGLLFLMLGRTVVNADTNDCVAIAEFGVKYYTVEDAWNAARNGIKITLQKDWEIDSRLELGEHEKATIEMNGFRIDRQLGSDSSEAQSEGEVIFMDDDSSLTLLGNNKPETEFKYRGLPADYAHYNAAIQWEEYTVTSGGLITGGSNKDGYGGGIREEDGCTLTCENVAVAGNYSEKYGGGIYIDKQSTLNLKNAKIHHNQVPLRVVSTGGGGIGVDGDSVTINMDNSEICSNRSLTEGGGIYSTGKGTSVFIINGSRISKNYASSCGGGVYFDGDEFRIESSDKTGVIANNICYNSDFFASRGAGICMSSRTGEPAKGTRTIKGLEIASNEIGKCKGEEIPQTALEGAGIYVDQQNVVIEDCKVTGNKIVFKSEAGGWTDVLDYEIGHGGGICNNAKYTTIKNCTITGNYGCMESGGGVYSDSLDDLWLKGDMIIEANTVYKNQADDLYLQTGTASQAYIDGQYGLPSENSRIGIRTEDNKDRQIGKNISASAYHDVFYSNQSDSCHIEYKDGNLYQKSGAKTYEVTVNGKSAGSYQTGQVVIIKDTSKLFIEWAKAEGIDLEDLADAKSAKTSFRMPSCAVSVEAKYGEGIEDITLTVDKPKGGSNLDTAGTLSWQEGDETKTREVPVEWNVTVSGEEETVAYGSVADYNTTYSVSASIYADDEESSFNLVDPSEKNVIIHYGNEEDNETQSVTVNSSGSIVVYGKSITTLKPSVKWIGEFSVIVPKGIALAKLKEVLPKETLVFVEDINSVGRKASTVRLNNPSENFWAVTNNDNCVVYDGTVNLPLDINDNDDIINTDHMYYKVNVTVDEAADPDEYPIVETPTLDPAGSVYFGEKLTVKAACATDGAAIKYSLVYSSGSTENKNYDADAGIVMTADAGNEETYDLKIWAEKNGVKSAEIIAKYIVANKTSSKDGTQQVNIYYRSNKESESTHHKIKTITANEGGTVTVTVPVIDNYKFDHWENLPSGVSGESTDSVITVDKLTEKINLYAVYKPFVTKLDINITEPEPGESLPQDVADANLSVKAGEYDLTEYLADEIEWTPDSSTIRYGTRYTAKVNFKEDPEMVFNDDLAATMNGEDRSSRVCVIRNSEEYYLYMAFETTSVVEPVEVDLPESIDVSRDDAQSGNWNLPTMAYVSLKDGTYKTAQMTWEDPKFDTDNPKAQTITVSGTFEFLNGLSIKEGCSNHVSITVNVGIAHLIAPTASVKAGSYDQEQLVSLSCDTKDAQIYYTLDGSEPTKDSIRYSDDKKIGITKSTVVKAKAFKEDWADSETAEFTYELTDPAAHQYADKKITEKATCTDHGTKIIECVVCGDETTKRISALEHVYDHIEIKAGYLKNGVSYDKCQVCGTKANVKILAGYSSYVVKNFKVIKGSKSFKVTWSKASKTNQKKMTGYQIRYSKKMNMSNAKYVKIGKNSESKKISKLSRNTRYYIQVRNYMVKDGKAYYSKWSSKKTIRTKF